MLIDYFCVFLLNTKVILSYNRNGITSTMTRETSCPSPSPSRDWIIVATPHNYYSVTPRPMRILASVNIPKISTERTHNNFQFSVCWAALRAADSTEDPAM